MTFKIDKILKINIIRKFHITIHRILRLSESKNDQSAKYKNEIDYDGESEIKIYLQQYFNRSTTTTS